MVVNFDKTIIQRLKENPDRHIYPDQNNNWFISHQGGKVDVNLILKLYVDGEIVKIWSDVPFEGNGFCLPEQQRTLNEKGAGDGR